MFESYLKPPLTFPTLTGSVVTFNAQYALPLKSHTVALTATQSGSGTPSPDNVRAINGYSAINISATGLNLWGGGYLVNSIQNAISSASVDSENKTVSYSASATADGHLFDFPKPTQYTLIFKISKSNTNLGVNMRVVWNDSTSTVLTLPEEATEPLTFIYVTPEGKIPSYISKANQSGTTYLYYDECGIFEGVHTVAEFEPFGTYTTITIGSTVYGGEYDARTGVLTVTHLYIKGSDINFTNFLSQMPAIYGAVSGIKNTNNNDVADLTCDMYETVSRASIGYTAPYSSGICISGNYIMIADTSKSWANLNEAKEDVKNANIVYPLATPQTIQLPPCPIDTLEGVNNIWADTGDTTLQYIKLG